MSKAFFALLVGIVLALFVSYFLTWIYPNIEFNDELLSRTRVDISSIVMALASGAAAALSMTTGLSAVLVGVMVAVAILPPTAALGLMLGYHQYALANGAFILLAVNIICINLSSNIVFLLKGINPRTRSDKQKAIKTALFYLFVWFLLLIVMLFILMR